MLSSFYSRESLDCLYERLEGIKLSALRVSALYIYRTYQSEKAKEYATHGVGRRLSTLVRCSSNVYEYLPPEDANIPSECQVENAALNIQAFVINVVGLLDNLAWVFVLERKILGRNGAILHDNEIGFQRQIVIDAFSPALKAYLANCDEWFKYIKNFRHAQAHRIPVYIPPCTYYDDGSCFFQPVMLHSYVESVGVVAFHGQMLNDFMNVIEIAEIVAGEL